MYLKFKEGLFDETKSDEGALDEAVAVGTVNWYAGSIGHGAGGLSALAVVVILLQFVALLECGGAVDELDFGHEALAV